MSSSSPKESFLRWDAAQVTQFLNLTLPEQSINTQFLDHKVDGSLLPFLTTEHLREMGIQSLASRLAIKKVLADLIGEQYRNNPPKLLHDPDYQLHHINIDNNYVQLESLSLSTVLVLDMFQKLGQWVQQQHFPANSPMLPVPQLQFQLQQLEYKKLQDNFLKLKTDLIPVIRLLKDSKPLPTPTLDPGVAPITSPTLSILTAQSDHSYWTDIAAEYQSNGSGDSRPTTSPSVNEPMLLNPLAHSTLANSTPNVREGAQPGSRENPQLTNSATRNSFNLASPTYLRRLSQDATLQGGGGKIIQQNLPKLGESRSQAEFQLPSKIPGKHADERPRLTGAKSLGSVHSVSTPLSTATVATAAKPILKQQTSLGSTATAAKPTLKHQASTATVATASKPMLKQQASLGSTATFNYREEGSPKYTQPSNEPLKQLRASSEDSCMKILQHAMKRHHIPRDDWSKYVLVICYGDKERILKLDEKPVIIFKELQELGKHPAIMLRQLAEDLVAGTEEQYENSRIGDDIPGGTL